MRHWRHCTNGNQSRHEPERGGRDGRVKWTGAEADRWKPESEAGERDGKDLWSSVQWTRRLPRVISRPNFKKQEEKHPTSLGFLVSPSLCFLSRKYTGEVFKQPTGSGLIKRQTFLHLEGKYNYFCTFSVYFFRTLSRHVTQNRSRRRPQVRVCQVLGSVSTQKVIFYDFYRLPVFYKSKLSVRDKSVWQRDQSGSRLCSRFLWNMAESPLVSLQLTWYFDRDEKYGFGVGKKNKTPPLGSTETKMQHLSAMTGGANEIHSCLFVFISNQIKWFDQNFKLKPWLVLEAVRWLCTTEFIKIAAIWVSAAIIHCRINSSDCRGSLKYWDFLLIDCGS